MPRISVTLPHQLPTEEVAEKIRPALEDTVDDFEGRELQIEWHDDKADFSFKSLAFTIKGEVTVDESEVSVHIDLPFAAMIYKDKVKKGVTKNVTHALES